MYSLIVPVYKNEGSLTELIKVLEGMNAELNHELEVVFVVDGSPDNSFGLLKDALGGADFESTLLGLSRNFGSFSAIRAGLAEANGQYFGNMAADLQDPPDVVVDMFTALSNDEADLCLGVRTGRKDPFWTRTTSALYWSLYRRLVQRDIPSGGVDFFACNQAYRDVLLRLEESNTSLVGQLIWLGFRRKEFPYQRRERMTGKSAWTFRRKLTYFMDSAFGFSDLPIRMLLCIGGGGMILSLTFGVIVFILRIAGAISEPGYAATILTILFFVGLNTFGLGIIGSYIWRTFENSKHRPLHIVASKIEFNRRNS